MTPRPASAATDATAPQRATATEAATEAWLRLVQIKGLSVTAKRALVTALGTPQALFDLNTPTAAELLHVDSSTARRMLHTDRALLGADLASMQQHDIRYLPFCSIDFPPLLNQLSAPPLGLFTRGHTSLLSAPQLAIVGSRNPTPSGRRTAEEFAAALSRSGLTIISGLAVGIDSAAHHGCLEAKGDTVAVVATGLDQVYPRSNQRLNDEIAARGLLVSEFVPGSRPRKEHFPQRNRLISGLSLGTLVVEADMRSGSLITARTAGEQGREVFAIPGSIHVPTSRGCHHLIRNGAKLVETVQDILDEIGHHFIVRDAPPRAAAVVNVANAAVEQAVFDLFAHIDFTPTPVDVLIHESGLSADEVSYILMQLEMQGLIAATSSGYQRLPQ